MISTQLKNQISDSDLNEKQELLKWLKETIDNEMHPIKAAWDKEAVKRSIAVKDKKLKTIASKDVFNELR